MVGEVCQPWVDNNYPDIEGNKCRNPGQAREQPWCFVNGVESLCDIPLCSKYTIHICVRSI